MRVLDLLPVLLGVFSQQNERAHKENQERPWKVTEIRRGEFVVAALAHGKKFRVVVTEEA